MEAKTCSFPWVSWTACFDSMGFRRLKCRICATSHALLFESEDSSAVECETSLFRLCYVDAGV
eukprot:6841871-Lingulodinium_polyedra.AAC.1